MCDDPTSIMIFAAGFGTRMGELTRNCPKPLLEIHGRSLLDHAIKLAQGWGPVIVNVHYLAPQIVGHLAHRSIAISHETQILETGGGLAAAQPLLGPGPVFTFNPDAIWSGENPFRALLAAWRAQDMDALLILVPADVALGRTNMTGDFSQDSGGRLHRGGDLLYTGAQIIKTSALAEISDTAFSLNRLWDLYAQRGRLYGIVHTGDWCDVGTPQGLAQARAMVSADE